MKITKKSNKIIGPSITCSYIWHIDTSKCAYWLDTYSVKVWRSYVLPNTNADHLCDIFFRYRAMFATCSNKEFKNQIAGHVIVN